MTGGGRGIAPADWDFPPLPGDMAQVPNLLFVKAGPAGNALGARLEKEHLVMTRKKYLGAMAVAMALVFVTACGKSSSPTSPSPSSSSSSTKGASITGTITGTTSGSSAGYAKLDGTSGVTITIAGTGLTVTVDSTGKFVFTGVPAGTVQLVITSGGASSTITLEGVTATDSITVKITLKGTTVSLDAEERNGTEMTEIEDRIAAINPAGTTRTLDVGSTRVSVPTTASIRHGGTVIDFTALKVGDRVHVRGGMTGGVFVATEVMVQNTNEKVPVNISGSIAGFTGSCPSVKFTVGTWNVETNGSTDFQKNACGSLANGVGVHLKGDVQPSGSLLATWVQLK